MTTIVGIKLSSENKAIVLGSDTQISEEDDDTGEFDRKDESFKKVIVGKTWALAHAGGIDKMLKLFNKVLEGRKRYKSSEDIANKLVEDTIRNYEFSLSKDRAKKEKWEDFFTKPHFELINLLNTTTMRHTKYKNEEDAVDLHYFLLATCPPDMGLWYIDSHGNLREVEGFNRTLDYLCIGSGNERVTSYIASLIDDDKIDSDNINIPEAIDLVRESLRRAKRDPHTGGTIDLVVLDEKGVHYYGDFIKSGLIDAENRLIEEIKSHYISS